jgi:hypothetical protein
MTDPDDLEPLLTPRPALAPRAGFDAELFARTERALARGRRLRQGSRVAVTAAVFAVGWWLGSGQEQPAPPENQLLRFRPVEVVTVPIVVPVPVMESHPGPVAAKEPDPATPDAAELLAEQTDNPARAAGLYRLAGDKYLLDRQDFRNARRCYRLFLARAGDAGMSPAADDNWLLAELKVSLSKERTDATRTDG